MASAQRKIQNDFGSISQENHAALALVPSAAAVSRDLMQAASKHSVPSPGFHPTPSAESHASPQDLTEKAYRALQMGFVALPIVAGIDKFAYVLTDWNHYLAPAIPATLGISAGAFMLGVGVVEIALGLGIAFKPRVFADLFALWMLAVIVNLLFQGDSFDLALFDFGLAAGACALARLSHARHLAKVRPPRSLLRTLRRVS